jgi:RNA polymerase sigma-70 factor (ECF subfamily)
LLSRGAAFAPLARPAIVNGAAGLRVVVRGKTLSVVSFTIVGERIVEIDLIADPEKLRGA